MPSPSTIERELVARHEAVSQALRAWETAVSPRQKKARFWRMSWAYDALEEMCESVACWLDSHMGDTSYSDDEWITVLLLYEASMQHVWEKPRGTKR